MGWGFANHVRIGWVSRWKAMAGRSIEWDISAVSVTQPIQALTIYCAFDVLRCPRIRAIQTRHIEHHHRLVLK
jgi:hypothetical protein